MLPDELIEEMRAWSPDLREAFDERVAIMVHHGLMPVEKAVEAAADRTRQLLASREDDKNGEGEPQG
jgi:hypothetical protein